MRVAALYDVHGNLPALEAVLADPRLAEVDLIVSGGDLVAGPMPSACLDLLCGYGPRVRFIRGNADRERRRARRDARSRWCADELGAERLATVAEWPLTIELDVAGGDDVLSRNAAFGREIVTRLTPDDELAAVLAAAPSPPRRGRAHAHAGRSARRDHRFVVAGSVGRPYEGLQGAFWALLGDDVELLRTDYDIESAAAAIRATAFPDAEEHRRDAARPAPARRGVRLLREPSWRVATSRRRAGVASGRDESESARSSSGSPRSMPTPRSRSISGAMSSC